MSDSLFARHTVKGLNIPKFKLSVSPEKKYKVNHARIKEHKQIKQNYEKNKKHTKVSGDKWVMTQREYLRWKKTPDFTKWRKKQFLRQGGTCYYCDGPLFGGTRQNIDHVIPKSLGGSNSTSNLVIACSKCNKDKNNKLLTYAEREALIVKNKVKKGTYLQNVAAIETESDVAERLFEMFNA